MIIYLYKGEIKMKATPKIINRIISFICIGVFAVGIISLGVGTFFGIKLYKENQELTNIRDNLIDNNNKQSQYDVYKFDEYYSVYVEDGYALYDDTDNDPLIFFTK